MGRNLLFSYLELAYSPICNYDFALIKNDEYFQSLVKESNLYIISQRKELTFESLQCKFVDAEQIMMHFEIRQKGNSSILQCEVPVYQPNLAADLKREVRFHFEYALPKPNPLPKTFPQDNIRNLLIYYHDDTFVGWLSPENFIQNFLSKSIIAKVSGPIEDFLEYKVHYVGKAIEQRVWKRLTGHSTLQEILSLEYPLHFGTLPTHEISILFFKFKDAIKINSISKEDKITQDIIDVVLGKNQPTPKTISIDAEKALINAMQPTYNKEFYNNYPTSKDGLYRYNLDGYSFQIQSHITLNYTNGMIRGSLGFDADSIVVKRGLPLHVIKNK